MDPIYAFYTISKKMGQPADEDWQYHRPTGDILDSEQIINVTCDAWWYDRVTNVTKLYTGYYPKTLMVCPSCAEGAFLWRAYGDVWISDYFCRLASVIIYAILVLTMFICRKAFNSCRRYVIPWPSWCQMFVMGLGQAICDYHSLGSPTYSWATEALSRTVVVILRLYASQCLLSILYMLSINLIKEAKKYEKIGVVGCVIVDVLDSKLPLSQSW